MNDTRAYLFFGLFNFVPYLLVSWAYMALVDGGSREFWIAFAVLSIVRLFFSLIETLGSVLKWRLFGKKFMVERFLKTLQDNNFPKREWSSDDFLDYLARIAGSEHPASVKSAAKEIQVSLATVESMGILVGVRMHSAAEAALDLYSPRAEATLHPEW